MTHEIEAKFLSVDKDDVRAKLARAGFVLIKPECLMKRKVFDFPSPQQGWHKWGRVRAEGDKVTMTIKETRGKGITDVFEVELVVDDFDKAVAFFLACGYPMKSTQETLREKWVREGVEATIDTWPGLSPFLEIEAGDEAAVREVASQLGFDFSAAMFGGVDGVYHRVVGIPFEVINALEEITFENPPKAFGV